ncbi:MULTISPECIES: tail fiber assembly protein [Citrobacter]|uniref:Tail fiber assembly protein n=2 Tax=Citrobacter TaxID=544 RepID=A0ABX8KBH5_9ENTR|nr:MULTISPECIES: tail fiber assembly protein [Citrobacter]EJB8469988.1 tail fiber assembly protein [Citrobacter freundii]EJB8561987.1 tail fiber assembly protein [Citrobacter freundii]MDM3405309.1 tail fiber assembly protein [Citrobacter sp. Cb022]QXA46221.1 tail fiber assembly protein [Citrobacter pasteurii]CEJ64447.1 Phage tail fiber assembly protein [Citrobacter pasteurii]
MKYCALNNGFYGDNTPVDKIPGSFVHISDDEGLRILDSQINGQIQPDDNGFPVLVPYPELTKDEQQERAEQKRQTLKSVADTEISWRQDAVDAEIATEEETAALSEWKKYRVRLMRVDTSKAPDIKWPELSV